MLIGIILILLGVYYIVKMLCPGFDIDISWNIIWPIILMVLGVEGIIRAKKLEKYQLDNNKEIGTVEANPNTEIYKIVEELLNK